MPEVPPQQPAAQPPRPSRQEHVVPPRQSTWPVVVGAVASGLVGFGLVFGLGIGRSRHATHDHPHAPTAAVAEVVNRAEPLAAADETLPPRIDAEHSDAAVEPAATSRWPTPTPDFQAAEHAAKPSRFSPPRADATDDRYAARTVSHEADQTSEAPRPWTSRFASPDLPPADLAPTSVPAAAASSDSAALEPAPHDFEPAPAPALDGPATEEAPHADLNSTAIPDATLEDPAPGDADQPATALADTEPSPASAEPPAASESLRQPATPTPLEQIAEAATEALPAADQEPEIAATPAADTLPATAEPAAFQPPTGAAPPASPFAAAPPAMPAARLSTGGDRDRGSPWSQPPTAAAVTVAAAEPAAPPPPTPAALPFAAAPPLGPAAEGDVDDRPVPGPFDDAPASAAAAGLTGQGVPGPLQLEGVQTPQLAVEKRGPKEIQVGKPARYEILVRNVGSATAHDILLRDAVPRGTSLIATTPPAAPAGESPASTGDLVWTLGELPPGGEVRVLMELMPEAEGEIGSVASVSFRADATLRSRSTKPALAIDCPEPETVRIGRDMQVSLTISNPGSGTATGVVLEAFLPETVSHRAGSELEFDVGQLRPGETKTIDLVLGTRGPGVQPARLVARADAGIEEVLQVPLEVTAPTLELAIDMPARRFLQRPATCRIAMVNAGTASARAVELAAQLPPGMKFVKANNAGWHDERTHRVLWNLEELPAGETGTVEAVVMPVQPGPQRITAAARSTDGPSAQVDHLCQVEGLAALSFQVMDSEDPIEVAGLTEYVIRVSNDGTKAASGVRVAATLLGDLEPVEATGPGGHRVENLAVEFEPLAKLGPGEEAVYRVRARGHRAGDQRVQVQLVSDDHPTPITKEEITSVYDDR